MTLRRRTATQRPWNKATRTGTGLYNSEFELLYSNITELGQEGKEEERRVVYKDRGEKVEHCLTDGKVNDRSILSVGQWIIEPRVSEGSSPFAMFMKSSKGYSNDNLLICCFPLTM